MQTLSSLTLTLCWVPMHMLLHCLVSDGMSPCHSPDSMIVAEPLVKTRHHSVGDDDFIPDLINKYVLDRSTF